MTALEVRKIFIVPPKENRKGNDQKKIIIEKFKTGKNVNSEKLLGLEI